MRFLRRFLAPSVGFAGETREISEYDFKTAEEKVRFLRNQINIWSLDALIHEAAASIVMDAGAGARDYRAQIDAVQRWCRDNITYINEKVETFQGALYTLQHRYGDCDDYCVLAGALLESITIPTELEILGTQKPGQKPDWTHIYLKAGLPPRKPTEWIVVECTIQGADTTFSPREYAEGLLAGKRGHAL